MVFVFPPESDGGGGSWRGAGGGRGVMGRGGGLMEEVDLRFQITTWSGGGGRVNEEEKGWE